MSKSKLLYSIAKPALCVLLVSGCSDPQPRGNDPAPVRQDEAPRKVSVTDSKAAPADDPNEPIAITFKKGEKRNPEASYIGAPKKGNVSFDFVNADLGTIALPLFSKQAGVTVEYAGPPRKLEKLRLVDQPWRDALCLICKFTQTHCRQSQIQGRIELVQGYDDPTAFLIKWDPTKKSDEGIGVIGTDGQPIVGASARGTPPAGSVGNTGAAGSSTPVQDPEYRDPSQNYNDKVDDIRRNVTPTNSGAR